MQKYRLVHGAICLLLTISTQGCRNSSIDNFPMSLHITTSSFTPGGQIPSEFTCDGANISPAFTWDTPPAQTRSLVVLTKDLDSRFRPFVHWNLYDLPPATTTIPSSLPRVTQLPNGSEQGLNGLHMYGYTGPCPPGTSVHHYAFRVYALDAKPDLPPGVKEAQIEKAMEGHILAAGQVIGTYHH